MTESNLFKRLKRVTPDFDWCRHEDKMTAGIPDCSYGVQGRGGWLELKTYDHLPRNNGVVKFHDLKPQQVNWLERRSKHQELVWILATFKDDYFLIHGKHSRTLNHINLAELIKISSLHGRLPFDDKISKVLSRGYL